MMLADTYIEYAQFTIKDSETTQKCQQAALKSLSFAEQHMKSSEFSIWNASLGRGLKSSNRYGIADPEEARVIIRELFY